MTEDEAGAEPAKNDRPALSPEKLAQKQRLAEALRENLRKRKAQLRGRRAQTPENPDNDDSGAGGT